MEKKTKNRSITAACLLLTFALWTWVIQVVDVAPIGPMGSSVGLATFNRLIHDFTGVNMRLYTVTDWLGLVPIAVCLGFAILGLTQCIGRRSIAKVDRDLLVLGGFYIAVIGAYLLFETVTINYRPTLINGYLEGSYPSSTTLLVTCVMPTAIMQLNTRIKNHVFRSVVSLIIMAFIIFMVAGRIVSGVHWITDIIGGALLSAGLVLGYSAATRMVSTI